jgi:glycosyltransferase involved in cell wall biosynthesis
MWDSGRTPTTVIPHGVAVDPAIAWTGELDRGISVVNGLARRGRLAGADIFTTAQSQVPLDLAGMGSERWGGLGDLSYRELHRIEARYRFFFNPIRYTSLPLAVVEAMAIGMPVVALATTELPRAISDGESGILSNDLAELVDGMGRLLRDETLARRMGQRARDIARDQFGIARFRRDWDSAIERVLNEGT